MVVVLRAFGTEIHVGGRMFEHAERRDEVVVLAGPSSRNRRRTDHLPGVGRRRAEIDEQRLHVGIAIDQHDILARQAAQCLPIERRLQTVGVGALLDGRHFEPARHLLRERVPQGKRATRIDHAAGIGRRDRRRVEERRGPARRERFRCGLGSWRGRRCGYRSGRRCRNGRRSRSRCRCRCRCRSRCRCRCGCRCRDRDAAR